MAHLLAQAGRSCMKPVLQEVRRQIPPHSRLALPERWTSHTVRVPVPFLYPLDAQRHGRSLFGYRAPADDGAAEGICVKLRNMRRTPAAGMVRSSRLARTSCGLGLKRILV